MSNRILQRIPAYKINITALRANLDGMFGDDYQVTIIDAFVMLELPRLLDGDEIRELRHASRYMHYARQNEAIRSLADRAVPGVHSTSSEPTSKSIDKPRITRRRGATSSTRGRIRNQGKKKEEPETHAKHDTPDAGEIPLFHPASQEITVVDFGTGLKSANRGFVRVEQSDTYEQGDRTQSGLYSVLRETGETSSVFDVTGRIVWSVDQHDQGGEEGLIEKFAIKRLHKHTAHAQFWAEYNSLKLLKSLDHPHLVETLSVFRYEENMDQYFNFLFPLALGNLKRLFRGSYDEDIKLQKRAQDSLWDQFAGLSSAVAYLHDSIQMAHRDIKPSNILIYEEPSFEVGLILKLTDFGLSIDLSNALTWEAGSLARQSAWLYDSPEIRRASPNDGSKASSTERFHIPSATDLLANDIWKLGCVFTEMLAFLVCGGSVGVTNFRDSITTTEDKISSDMFNDTRFDDGEKVKDQVLNSLEYMAHKDMRARWLQPVLGEMLAKSAQRPTIAGVCDALVQVNFPNINFDDGLRLVRFTPADRMSPLTRIENLRLGLQKWIGRTVDWGSSPNPRPRLNPGQFLMTWKWQGSELYMSLSQDELDRYKPMCLPRTTRNTPILPVVNQPASSSTQRSTNIPLNNISQPGGINSHTPGNVALGGAVQSSTTQQSSGLSRDMYWCIEKIFTEPTENHLFSILKSEDLEDDKDLYDRVNKAIRSARYWVWWLFSWKRCTEVDFIEFCVVRRGGSEVDPMKSGILPPLTTRGPITAQSYTHAVPLPHDVQMRAAGKQMVLGLMYPSKGRGEKTIISMLPKKLNPPPLLKEMGQVGWGLHAKMGFSQWKFFYWLIFCFFFNAIFVALWLVYINPTDLQNAFVPTFVATVAVTIGLGVVQVSELRDAK